VVGKEEDVVEDEDWSVRLRKAGWSERNRLLWRTEAGAQR